tara:strand:- start:18 stop:335 length:318 start_codon:yes stop_codon:yes gene_type:complete
MLGTTRSIVTEERVTRIQSLEKQLTKTEDPQQEVEIRKRLFVLYRQNSEFDESTSQLSQLRSLDPQNLPGYDKEVDYNNARKDTVRRTQQAELVHDLYFRYGNGG